jgi:hypothetical protein
MASLVKLFDVTIMFRKLTLLPSSDKWGEHNRSGSDSQLTETSSFQGAHQITSRIHPEEGRRTRCETLFFVRLRGAVHFNVSVETAASSTLKTEAAASHKTAMRA